WSSDVCSSDLLFCHLNQICGITLIKILIHKKGGLCMISKINPFTVVSLTLLLALAGCAGESPDDSGSETESGSGDRTQISFIHWRGEDKAVFDDIIAQFEDEFPEIGVEMNIYPSEQYQATGQRMLTDGSTGDVFTSFPGAQFEAIAGAGFFEDL